MMYKLICFDFDGVLLDSGAHCEDFAMAEFPGMTRDEAKRLYIGNIFDELAKVVHPKVDPSRFVEIQSDYLAGKALLALCEGIDDLLPELSTRLGVPFVINSSSSETAIHSCLERHRITEYFSFIADKHTSPSKVEKFAMIAERYNIALSDMVFLTDTW